MFANNSEIRKALVLSSLSVCQLKAKNNVAFNHPAIHELLILTELFRSKWGKVSKQFSNQGLKRSAEKNIMNVKRIGIHCERNYLGLCWIADRPSFHFSQPHESPTFQKTALVQVCCNVFYRVYTKLFFTTKGLCLESFWWIGTVALRGRKKELITNVQNQMFINLVKKVVGCLWT